MRSLLLLAVTFWVVITASYGQNVPSYVPTNGLVGWWPFNGNANDESGNGNNGTVNGATLTSDRFGNSEKAFSFNGSSSFIQCINSGPVGNPTISLSFWLKASNPGVSSQILGWGQSQNTPGATFRILTQHVITAPGCSSNIAFDTYQSARCFATFYNSTWDNYILVYNSQLGNTVQFSSLYKNGVLLAECYLSSSNSTNILQQFAITFGRDHGLNTAYLDGQLDDIGIWNRALNQQEITQLYTSSTPGNVGINVITPQRNLHVKDVMRMEPRNSAPDNPVKGDIYFDGILNKLRVYDGTAWQNCW